jgi:ATP-dependent helicase/nuclease subunit A
MFEHLPSLPAENRVEAAMKMLAESLPGLPDDLLRRNAERFERLVLRADLTRFFGAASRAEVPIAGTLMLAAGKPVAVNGRIDRLVVTPDGVDLLDIKTGQRGSGAQNAGIHRQLALYRALLMRIFPDREVRAHILWVESEYLEPVPEALLDQALASITVR